MNPRSIRFRLTAWYSTVLAMALAIFGVFTWFAVHERFCSMRSTKRSLTESRAYAGSCRIRSARFPSKMRDEFKEHSVLGPGGDLFQVCDAAGVWLYRSAPLENDDVAIGLPGELAGQGPGGGPPGRRDESAVSLTQCDGPWQAVHDPGRRAHTRVGGGPDRIRVGA